MHESNNKPKVEETILPIISAFGGKDNRVQSTPIAFFHRIYIDTITDPKDWVDELELIRNASENDVIKLYINSEGGSAFTAIQFLKAMAESDAHIIASIEAFCASAATFIFLAADEYELSPDAIMMCHNYSSGQIGKGNELYYQAIAERKWSERLIGEHYKGFLTDVEISQLLEGKDFWFLSEEIVERVKKYAEYRKQQLEIDDDEVPVDEETVMLTDSFLEDAYDE